MTRTPRALASVGIVAVVALVGSVALVANGWSPTVPPDAASTVVARTVLTGPIAPDASPDDEAEVPPRSPAGQECLPEIERPAGPLSLCWEAYRDPADSDPEKDYYRLRVYGTFGGETGTGVRWATVRARLVGEPADDAFQAWPEGVYDGPCEPVEVSLGAFVPGSGDSPTETRCGRTTGNTDPSDWSHRVTWTCVGCLIASHADRSIALYEFVGVPEGAVPSWEIFADLGS